MTTKKITQKKAKEMLNLLTQIHGGLKDKNQNKKFKEIPFIEIAWMSSIENHLPKTKKFIHNQFNKFHKNHFIK